MAYVGTALWALAYFLLFTPCALTVRLLRPDPLDLRPRRGSAWQARRGPSPDMARPR